VHNKLVLTCDDPKVIELFRKAIGGDGEVRADIVVDLRYAIRQELGFGDEIVDTERENVWILRVGIGQWSQSS
jgi:hypothetical protein